MILLVFDWSASLRVRLIDLLILRHWLRDCSLFKVLILFDWLHRVILDICYFDNFILVTLRFVVLLVIVFFFLLLSVVGSHSPLVVL